MIEYVANVTRIIACLDVHISLVIKAAEDYGSTNVTEMNVL